MPLTPAEKMKRYREKLKKDPEKYNEYKKKDLKRVQMKNKKISELSEKEKDEQRQKWRNQKRTRKENKSKDVKNPASPSPKPSLDQKLDKCKKIQRKTASKWRRLCYKIKEENVLLKKKIEIARKRHYRIEKKRSKIIEKLENQLMKMQARQEVMECTLRTAYAKCRTHKKKFTFKNLASDAKKEKGKKFIGKLLGLKGSVRIQRRIKLMSNLKSRTEIETFFLRDDVSRCTSGKKECRTINKKKHQIRYLTDTLYNLHRIYKEEGGKYSLSTFHKYKPLYVLSPSIQNRDTCLCIKHSNMEMLFTALLKNGVFPNDIKNVSDVFPKLTCNVNSFLCMSGKCELCKQNNITYILEDDSLDKTVQWNQWERVDHIYTKTDKGKVKQILTKKTVKKCKSNTIRELVKKFETSIKAFQLHFFNWKHQQRQYRQKINNLGTSEAAILCDFSENYECKLTDEVQALHFGASKQQITLHCGMIYWANRSQSFCTISNSKCHEPSAIWAHLTPVIELIKKETPTVKKIHIFSDGPSSQYRQKKNFYLTNVFTTKFDFDYCTWNFSESGHGKGVADGIGGAVKRSLDKQVAYGHDISNAEDAFRLLNFITKSIKYFFIDDTEIDNIEVNYLRRDLKAIPGTMQIHQIITKAKSGFIQHRVLSCFCLTAIQCECDCFPLSTHIFNDKSSKATATNKRKVKVIPPVTIVDSNVKKNVSNNVPPNVPTNETLSECKLLDLSDKLIINLDTDNTEENLPDEITINLDTENTLGNSSDQLTNVMQSTSTYPYLFPIQIDEVTTGINTPPTVPLNLIDLIDNLNPSEFNRYLDHNDISDTTLNSKSSELTVLEKSTELNANLPMSNISSAPTSMQNILLEKYPRQKSGLQIISIENVSLKRRASTTPQKPEEKKRYAAVKKENNSRNKNPSIRTAISRTLQCFLCKQNLPFTSKNMTKCMVCSNRFCVVCTDGQIDIIDYICQACLGEE